MRKDWEPSYTEKSGWSVNFTIEGNRIRRRLGIRDKSLGAIARQKAKKLYREIWESHLVAPEPVSGPFFYEAAHRYIEGGGEARFIPPLIKHFGATTMLAEIGDAEIKFAALQIYPNAAPETHRRQVRVPINAIRRTASGERREPSTDNARTRWLTPEEAERLLKAAADLTLPRHADPEPFTLAKIAFLLGSGARTGECFAAKIDDWNPATNQLWIPGDTPGAGKTALAARWVSLPQRSVDLMGDLPEEDQMFRTPYGKPITMRQNGGGQMQTAFNKARDAAELEATGPNKVTPHVLRHTWATWYYAQTKDYGGLLDKGGWAKSDTAERYRKLAPLDLPNRLLAHGWDFRQDFGNTSTSAALRIVSKG